jgi:hypothetical protein
MSSPDQLIVSPYRLEAAAQQLTNDAEEAATAGALMADVGSGFGTPETGLSIGAALGSLATAFAAGFGTVAAELTDLATHVSTTARLSVLVDTNAAGYFTASDAI